MHDLRRLLDYFVWGLAALSSISFWQDFALAVTILSGLASLYLAYLRITAAAGRVK